MQFNRDPVLCLGLIMVRALYVIQMMLTEPASKGPLFVGKGNIFDKKSKEIHTFLWNKITSMIPVKGKIFGQVGNNKTTIWLRTGDPLTLSCLGGQPLGFTNLEFLVAMTSVTNH